MIVDIKIFDPNLVIRRKRTETTLKSKRTGKPANLPSPKGGNPLGKGKSLGKNSKKRVSETLTYRRGANQFPAPGDAKQGNPKDGKKLKKENREEFEGVEVKLPP